MLSINQVLLDEISLEGLEGITYESLWVRLDQRIRFLKETIAYVDKQTTPACVLFPLEELENHEFLDCLFRITLKFAKKGDISIFKLSKARATIKLYDRNESFKSDTGTIYCDEKKIPKDPYQPMIVITDGPIRGSCRDYKERKNVTQEVIAANLTTLAQFESNYPTCVLVASSTNRSMALFGAYKWQQYDDLRPEAYAVFESIGRKRNYGELNFGPEAPQFEDAKIRLSYYKYRDLLVEENLVIAHLMHIFSIHRKKLNTAYVLYLPRFRPVLLNQLDGRIVAVMNLFVERNTSLLPLEDVYKVMGFSLLKSLRKAMQRFSEIFQIREVASKDEDGVKSSSKRLKHELAFSKPLDRIYSVCSLYECNQIETEAAGDAEDDDADDGNAEEETSWDLFNLKLLPLPPLSSGDIAIDPSNLDLQRWRRELQCVGDCFASRIYQLIRATEDRGISMRQLRSLCDVPFLQLRQAVKTLTLTKRIVYKMIQLRRCKTRFFMAHDSKTCNADGSAFAPSDRFLERCELMTKFLREEIIIDDLALLRRYIMAKEEHLHFQIDSRTCLRVLLHLREAGRMHFYGYRLQSSLSHFYRCIYFAFLKPSDMSMVDVLHNHFLLRFKFEFFFSYPLALESIQAIKLESFSELETSETRNIDVDIIHPNQQGSVSYSYGHIRSKLERAFKLYRFLFHLLTPGSCMASESAEDYRHKLPKLWKMFPNDKLSFFDIIIYLPLNLFCKLCIVRYVVPGLEEMLEDPVKSNQLLYELEPYVRRHILHSRKAFQDIYETFNTLSLLGMVTVFDGRSKHRNTSMLLMKRSVVFDCSLTTDDATPVTYQLETEADIQALQEDVYHHLILSECGTKSKQEREKCPFNPQLNLHASLITRSKDKKRKMLKSRPVRVVKKLKVSNGQKLSKPKRVIIPPVETMAVEEQKSAPKAAKASSTILTTRCTWSLAEDKFLIKCRLASALIDRSSRSVVCVSSLLLHRLLRKHLNISKAAPAIARHLLQLNRRQTVRQLVNLCLLELNWIEVKKLTEAVENGPQDEEEICDIDGDTKINTKSKLFVKVLKMIMDYEFSNTQYFMTSEQLKLKRTKMDKHESSEPPTIEDIMTKYNIINPSIEVGRYYFNTDPKSFYDINLFVIANVLISSLLSIKLNLYRYGQAEPQGHRYSFLRAVLKALKRYPELMINAVIKRLIAMELISRNKTKTIARTNQKFNCYAYNISSHYFFKLTKFDIRYDKLDEHRVIDQTNEAKVNIELRNANTLLSSLQFAEALASNAFGLPSAIGSSPRSTQTDADEEEQTQAKFNFEANIPEEFHKIEPRKAPYSNKPFKRKSASRSIILHREQHGGDVDNQMLSLLRVLPEDIKISHCDVKITTASMLDPCNVVHSKTLECLTTLVDKNVLGLLCDERLEDCLETYNYGRFDVLNENATRIIDKTQARQMIEFVESKDHLGAKLEDLAGLLNIELEDLLVDSEDYLESGTYGCLVRDRLVHFLQHCERKQVLFGVGVITRTWVHRHYLKFWVAHALQPNEMQVAEDDGTESTIRFKSKEVAFVPKVWKQPNGQVNLDLLCIFFTNILGSLSFRSVSHEEHALLEYFRSFLPLVQLMEMIEILIEIGSLERKIVIQEDEESIYGHLDPFNRFFMTNEELEAYKETREVKKKVVVYYDPTIDCYTRLGNLYKRLSNEP